MAVDDAGQAEVLDLTVEVLEVDLIFTEVELGELIESYVPVVKSSSTIHHVDVVTGCSHTIVLNQVAHLLMELQVAFCVRSIVRDNGFHVVYELISTDGRSARSSRQIFVPGTSPSHASLAVGIKHSRRASSKVMFLKTSISRGTSSRMT